MDFLSLLVRVCRNTFSTKLMQQCIQVTSLPWQLRVFYFLYVPWAPRRLWRQLADVFVSITITSNLSLISNITSPVATEVHIWYLLHFWKHTLPSNQETRTFKPLELMPSCLAHDLLEDDPQPHQGRLFTEWCFLHFFCNTFSRQVFLDVLPPKVIRWIGPKKDLKTRHGVSQQWSKIKYYDHLPFGFSFPTMIVTWLAYCSGHHSTKTSQERRVFGFRPEIVDITRWISITFDP